MLMGKSRSVGRIRCAVAVSAIALTLLIAGVASAQDATPIPYEPGNDLASLGGSLVSDGSSTVGPLTEAVAEEFGIMLSEEGGSEVQVEVSISGTGGGFERFCAGETDLQNASRAISEEEIALCQQGGVYYFEFEVAFDGIAVVVNPENDFVECLTVEQLNMMWKPEGFATMWNEIDPSFPEEPIVLYGPGTDSGTFDYFTNAINGEGASMTDYSPSEDDNQLVLGVDSNALGYFGLAYYENNADQLKLVAVDSGSGCVSPSAETVADGSYAPLSRPLFVYLNAESLGRPEVQEFARLPGQRITAGQMLDTFSPVETYLEDQPGWRQRLPAKPRTARVKHSLSKELCDRGLVCLLCLRTGPNACSMWLAVRGTAGKCGEWFEENGDGDGKPPAWQPRLEKHGRLRSFAPSARRRKDRRTAVAGMRGRFGDHDRRIIVILLTEALRFFATESVVNFLFSSKWTALFENTSRSASCRSFRQQ